MIIMFFGTTVLFFSLCFFIALFLLVKPASAIEMQRRFYELINWRIEPISMTKELRNTRLMGWVLVILMLIALVYLFIQR